MLVYAARARNQHFRPTSLCAFRFPPPKSSFHFPRPSWWSGHGPKSIPAAAGHRSRPSCVDQSTLLPPISNPCSPRNPNLDNSIDHVVRCALPQVVPTTEVFEDLGRKYTFRFIGDSTTRRLAESFMSIVSGEGSPHPKAQERIDFSTKNLKVGSWRKGNGSVGRHRQQR